MWRKAAPLLVLLSVALNAAFVGAWSIRMAQSYATFEAPYDGPVWSPLHRQLGVTPEQWGRIEPQLETFRQQTRAIHREMRALRSQMVDLIAEEDPDPRAIAEKQQEIRQGQARMQQLVVEHLLAEKEVLTAAQEEQLFQMMREQTCASGPGRMLRFGGSDSGPQTAGETLEDFAPGSTQ